METLPMFMQDRALRNWALFLLLIAAFLVPAQADKSAKAADKKDTESSDKKKELPLKPTRKVEFATDEGTWLSLDVSPDGKTIIFDLIGDLYTVPMSGGETKKLTSGLAFNNQPSYSPDGKKITYI